MVSIFGMFTGAIARTTSPEGLTNINRMRQKLQILIILTILIHKWEIARASIEGQNQPTTTEGTKEDDTPKTDSKHAANREGHRKSGQDSKISYIVPGDKIEIFDDSKIDTIYIEFANSNYGTEKRKNNNSIKAVETQLNSLAYQPNVIYSGNLAINEGGDEGPGLKMKANNIFDTAREVSNTLSRIKILIGHIDQYYPTGNVPKARQGCTLNVPNFNLTLALDRLKQTLEGERLQNEPTNGKYTMVGDTPTIGETDNIPDIGLGEMGAALLNTEIAIYRSDKVLREAEKELITKQEILESLVNREMPPVILAGMDIQLDCVEKGREDNIHLEHCHQGKRMVKCRAAVMKEGKGIIVHKIIAIPYFRDGRTLRLKFDENLRYKKGTGKVYDIGECTKVGLQVKCPNILVEANDCLENLTKASQVVPDSCLVEELPESRPLIINTELGTLVAQQSDTSLLAEYNDKAITNDPFILSNQKELELVYGTEEIVVPPLDVADDSLFLPNGTFEALEKIFEDGSWQSKWEDFLPLHLRQIITQIHSRPTGIAIPPKLGEEKREIFVSSGSRILPCDVY